MSPIAINARVVRITLHLEGGASIDVLPEHLPAVLGLSEEQSRPFLQALATPTSGGMLTEGEQNVIPLRRLMPVPPPEPLTPAASRELELMGQCLKMLETIQAAGPRGIETSLLREKLGLAGDKALSGLSKALWARLRRTDILISKEERVQVIVLSRGRWLPGHAINSALDLLRDAWKNETARAFSRR